LWATVLDAGLRLRLGALEWRDVDLAVVLDSVEPSMHAVGAVIFRKT
jgi:hypothetical protein